MNKEITELFNIPVKNDKPIQLVFCLQNGTGSWYEGNYPRVDYSYLRLHSMRYKGLDYDLIVSINQKGESRAVFLGHWNSGKS